ncbi:MAG: hypothetical protein IJ906_12430 [Oscillospiraceae bacterium]|nr:hypothetical protein [Oscillospiraceae bacterium]
MEETAGCGAGHLHLCVASTCIGILASLFAPATRGENAPERIMERAIFCQRYARVG